MAEKSKNTQHISLRVPLKELSVIDTFAAANDLSRAQAVLHFVRQGIAAEASERFPDAMEFARRFGSDARGGQAHMEWARRH